MKAEDIREIQYHYSRTLSGEVKTGKIDVAQVYKDAQGRRRVVGVDLATGKDITLWPRDIVRPVRVRGKA